jgi:hypothetical protein
MKKTKDQIIGEKDKQYQLLDAFYKKDKAFLRDIEVIVSENFKDNSLLSIDKGILEKLKAIINRSEIQEQQLNILYSQVHMLRDLLETSIVGSRPDISGIQKNTPTPFCGNNFTR